MQVVLGIPSATRVPEFIHAPNGRRTRSLTAEHSQRFHHCPNKIRNGPGRKKMTAQTYLEGQRLPMLSVVKPDRVP